MRKLLAFTLSEVMITMTIVGVVAALTIPNLRYERTKKEYSAKLKNFYSRMDNAVADMEAELGSAKDILKPATDAAAFSWYKNNVDPYLGHSHIIKKGQGINNYDTVYLKDGSSLYLYSAGCVDLVYDVNADRGPNQLGFDRYIFLYCFSDYTRNEHFGNKNIFFGTYGATLSGSGLSRDKMVEKCSSSPQYCTKLLQNDQWEFKGDYPHKF